MDMAAPRLMILQDLFSGFIRFFLEFPKINSDRARQPYFLRRHFRISNAIMVIRAPLKIQKYLIPSLNG